MMILKLGGSIITEKGAKTPTINNKNLKRISKEIKNALNHLNTNDSNGLIIVHGAGSFGHPFASEYQIGNIISSKEEFEKKKIGFSLTQNCMRYSH